MKKNKKDEFARFMAIVRRLRRDCPWDRSQTHRSLRTSLLEEAYEVVDAINGNRAEHLRNELGDLLLNIALHAVIAQERNDFTIRDILRSVSEKLIRRHPHVFGRGRLRTPAQVATQWEALKLKEGRSSLLDGVPRNLPALLKARRLQEKASKIGFDWKDKRALWAKVEEELKEFRQALKSRRREAVEEEFGDLLFSLVNYSRFIGVQPEFALNRSAAKFTRRFRGIERELRRRGIPLSQAGLPLLDALWNRTKRSRA